MRAHSGGGRRYGMNEWRENLRECLLMAGVQDKPVVFLFDDTQIIM